MTATIHETTIAGLPVRTGDIICTRNGAEGSLAGRLWETVGHLVPGEVDHVILYVGPDGRCVEAAARGVIAFEVPEEGWPAASMAGERVLQDTLVGVADPLAGRGLGAEEEGRIRAGVAAYCLEQAVANKPYNFNVFDPNIDSAFYCSQLIYRAYLEHGVDLAGGAAEAGGHKRTTIVLPQVLWQNSRRLRVAAGPGEPGAEPR